MAHKKIIWQIKDGKRGHENQSAGLIQALAQRHDFAVIELPLAAQRASWIDAALARYKPANERPAPDLIIATGSQTHATLLAAGRASGAPTVLIMAPPRGLTRLYDLCIIPAHDARTGSNIITTQGAMNLIRPGQNKAPDCGLFLIGGPSQHHGWDEAALLEQIHSILNAENTTQWTLTTSRRTPESTTRQLHALQHPRLQVVPVEATTPTWLPQALAPAAQVWVTEDSVSMVYEALTANATVGLLQVPRTSARSRVIRGLDALIHTGNIATFDPDSPDLTRFPKPAPLNEAERVANIVARKFLQPEPT